MIQLIKTLLLKPEVKTIVKIIGPTIYHQFKVWLNKYLNKINSNIESKWDEYAGGAYDSTLDPRNIQYEEIA